jgi:hypothetical protein
MGFAVKKSLKLMLIAFSAVVLGAVVDVLLSLDPYNVIGKFLWLLIAVYIFSRQEDLFSIFGHSIWIFLIPFILGYFQTKGVLVKNHLNPELTSSVYFQPKMLVMHVFNYCLYVAVGYAALLTKK